MWSTHEVDLDGKVKQRMYWPYISPGTYQYCNLGSITKPQYNKIKPKGLIEGDVVFVLAVYWPTPDFRNGLLPGSYSFEIIVGCENAETISQKYILNFNKTWNDNEKEMLFHEINISEIK